MYANDVFENWQGFILEDDVKQQKRISRSKKVGRSDEKTWNEALCLTFFTKTMQSLKQ